MTTKEAEDVLLEIRPNRPRKTEDRRLQVAIDTIMSELKCYEELIKSTDVTVDGIKDKTKYSGCFNCDAHVHCVDAFQPHSVYCNSYHKGEE